MSNALSFLGSESLWRELRPAGAWALTAIYNNDYGPPKQIERMLGVTYKTAWFMTMRLGEAMRDKTPEGAIGGENKVVEADETFVGDKKKNVHKGKPELSNMPS